MEYDRLMQSGTQRTAYTHKHYIQSLVHSIMINLSAVQPRGKIATYNMLDRH